MPERVRGGSVITVLPVAVFTESLRNNYDGYRNPNSSASLGMARMLCRDGFSALNPLKIFMRADYCNLDWSSDPVRRLGTDGRQDAAFHWLGTRKAAPELESRCRSAKDDILSFAAVPTGDTELL
jgi:hypothetical protein